MKRRILCVALSIAMLLMLTVPANAVSITNENNPVVNESESILILQEGYTLSLVSVDYENGDSSFSLIENGIQIYTAYVDQSEQTIIEADLTNTTYHTTQIPPRPITPMVSISSTTSQYTIAGTVSIDHYVQGMVMTTNYLTLAYSTESTEVDHDFRGSYNNIAAFAAFIAAALLIPGALSSELAKAIVSAVGVASSGVIIINQSYPVKAIKTTVTWRGNPRNSTKYEYISGSYYRCIADGLTDKTDYDGTYYPVNSYANHNVNLPGEFYPLFWSGYDNFVVVGWS